MEPDLLLLSQKHVTQFRQEIQKLISVYTEKHESEIPHYLLDEIFTASLVSTRVRRLLLSEKGDTFIVRKILANEYKFVVDSLDFAKKCLQEEGEL